MEVKFSKLKKGQPDDPNLQQILELLKEAATVQNIPKEATEHYHEPNMVNVYIPSEDTSSNTTKVLIPKIACDYIQKLRGQLITKERFLDELYQMIEENIRK